MKKIFTERFARLVLVVIGISTALFVAAQYVSFLITQEEQEILIEWYFKVVGLECGALMLKRVAEIVVARVKKKEGLTIERDEYEPEQIDPVDYDNGEI